MASVDVINQKGEKVNSIELDDTVFNAEIRDTSGAKGGGVAISQAPKRYRLYQDPRTDIRGRKEALAAERDGTSSSRAPTGRPSGLEVEPSSALSLAPTLSPFPRKCERLLSDQS